MTGPTEHELPAEITALHNAIDANLSHARWVEQQLHLLAGAADIMGNTHLCSTLMRLAEDGVRLAEEVRTAQSGDTMRQVREAQQGSQQMMQAILAGVFATPEEREAREKSDV